MIRIPVKIITINGNFCFHSIIIMIKSALFFVFFFISHFIIQINNVDRRYRSHEWKIRKKKNKKEFNMRAIDHMIKFCSTEYIWLFVFCSIIFSDIFVKVK